MLGARPSVPRSSESPRGVRTKSAWLLVVPFLVFSRPTPDALTAGAALAVLGLMLRGWAAGTIRKDEVLTTWGPYAFLRHPLYVGSFFIGFGLGIAGGHWAWPLLVFAFFVATYRRTVAQERERLAQLFGSRYLEYASHVPAMLPRLGAYRPAASPVAGPKSAVGAPLTGDAHRNASASAVPGGFAWVRYLRNHEWEALLGVAAVLGVLALKMRSLG